MNLSAAKTFLTRAIKLRDAVGAVESAPPIDLFEDGFLQNRLTNSTVAAYSSSVTFVGPMRLEVSFSKIKNDSVQADAMWSVTETRLPGITIATHGLLLDKQSPSQCPLTAFRAMLWRFGMCSNFDELPGLRASLLAACVSDSTLTPSLPHSHDEVHAFLPHCNS